MNNLLSISFSICLMFCYFPQLLQTVKTKNVEGISELFWIILTTGLICNIILLVRTNASPMAIVPQCINLACAIVMVTLVARYQ